MSSEHLFGPAADSKVPTAYATGIETIPVAGPQTRVILMPAKRASPSSVNLASTTELFPTQVAEVHGGFDRGLRQLSLMAMRFVAQVGLC